MNGQMEKGDGLPSIVLVVVDFSEASNRALQWAVKMARCLNAHLTVLHTFRLLQAKNGEVISMKKKNEEEAVIRFNELETNLLLGKEISYDFKTEVGFYTDRIEDYSSRNSIQLLVLDKTTTEQNKETFEELIKNLQIPLVIIP